MIAIFQSIIKFLGSLFTGFKESYELRQKLNKAHKKIGGLESENRELKEKLKFKEKMFFENNALWVRKKDGTVEGPFCSGCGEQYLNPIHLHKENDYTWYCPICKIPIHIKKYKKTAPKHVPGRGVF